MMGHVIQAARFGVLRKRVLGSQLVGIDEDKALFLLKDARGEDWQISESVARAFRPEWFRVKEGPSE